MAVKKTILKKKIEGVVYDIYQKTSADIVVYDETSTVAEKIASLVTGLAELTAGDDSVDKKIQVASDALFQKIMGVTDQSQLAEAFDTLKEVSDYLNTHGAVVDGFTNDIDDLQGRMDTVEGKVSALEGVVGNAEGGLVKDVAANKAAIGDASSGLTQTVNTHGAAISALQAVAATKTEASDVNGNIKVDGEEVQVYDETVLAGRVTALEGVQATKVEASETNGNIKVNGQEVQVYNDTAIAATKITQDETHRFTTDTEKAAWNANAEIIVANEIPSDLAETDLLFLTVE